MSSWLHHGRGNEGQSQPQDKWSLLIQDNKMTIFYIVSTIKKLNIDVNYRVNADCSQHYSRPNSDIARFYVPVSVTATACIQTCIILIMLFKCYKTQYTVITLLSGLLWKSKQLHKWTSTFRRCQINGKECMSEEIYRQGGQEKQ